MMRGAAAAQGVAPAAARGVAPAAARGVTAVAEGVAPARQGGDDDPLSRMYWRVCSMGKGGADGDMYRGIVRAGPRKRQLQALKYRRPDDDPQREIEALRAVRHPNIVELLQVFEPYGERRATVLAFLEADGDLSGFLRRRAGRDPEERLPDSACHGIAVQLLAALEHMHGRSFIHRDVKPSNILVFFGEPLETCRTSSGKPISCSLRVQLADLSRARRLPSCSAGRRKFRLKTTVDQGEFAVDRGEVMSTRVTTAVFLAPEVPLTSKGEREDTTRYSTAIDIWAFGAVLYQVLSLEHFVPTYNGDITDVIGWYIRRIGPNDASTASSATYRSALEARSSPPTTRPLTEYQGSGWPWVRAALLWEATARPSAHQLAQTPWAEPPEAGSAPAAAQRGTTPKTRKREA